MDKVCVASMTNRTHDYERETLFKNDSTTRTTLKIAMLLFHNKAQKLIVLNKT